MPNLNNFMLGLKILNAQHARILSTKGTAAQRLSLLTQAGVAVGTKVFDSVTKQPVEVVSSGVAYLPSEVIDAVR
jgi:hypothetical protein